MRDEEVARQRDRILRGPQVVRDREYPLAEDLIADSSGTVDVSLPVLAKVSSLVEILRLGGGGVMNWCISCGPSLLWLPVKSALTSRGCGMRFWLVASFVTV